MPLFAKVAPSAGLRRVDSHSHSWLQGLKVAIQRFRADLLHSRRKFVPQHKWTLDGRVSNPSVLVGVEVAAANPRYTDTKQNFSGPRWSGRRDLLYAQVAPPVQARSQHRGWV